MRLFPCLLMCIFILMISGCSGGSNVTTPDMAGKLPVADFNGNLGVIADSLGTDGNPASGAGVLGLYQGSIDKENLTGELTPLRESTLDDTLEIVDITNFLMLAPCSECAKLMNIEMNADSNIVMSIGIKHPFDVGDPLKPITGRNRADLHVFNVEGTVLFEDIDTLSFAGIGVTRGAPYLANADGYSPYLDIVLDNIFPTAADIHPYILHFDDYTEGNYNPASATGFDSVTNPPPSGNLVMAMGCDYDVQQYEFDIPDDTSLNFIYAIGCTYAVSAASKIERFTPEYQVPQHNKKAASEVSVEIVSNDLASEDALSSAELNILVLDMSHGVAVGEALNEMKADSSVSGISVEISGVTSGAVIGGTTPSGGDGRDPANPLVFPVTVNNDLEAPEGWYQGLVKVTDAYPAGLNESPLLDGKDAIERVDPIANPLEGIYELTEFATYAAFDIYVETGNTPPIAVLSPSNVSVCDGTAINFDASLSTDLEDDAVPIPLNFEFDFDYDGVDFVSDTGAPSTDSYAISPEYYEPGPYTAAVRVTDSGGLTDIATCDIQLSDVPSADDWTVDVTDPNSITYTRYFHTRDDLEETNDRRAYGLEGTAYGNGYVYLTFFTGSGGVYFTRSSDSGANWDTPTEIASGLSNIVGATIAAAGSEVFILYGDSNIASVRLLKNTNSGEGTWDEYTVGTYAPGTPLSNLGVAVDPTDTNYVYAVMVRDEDYDWFGGSYLLRNNTGGSGTWLESYSTFTPQANNGCQLDLGVNSDGSVYHLHMSNVMIGVRRSDDHGGTFTPWSYGSNVLWTHYWGGEADMCFDPNNEDVVYMIWTTMGTNPPYGYRRVILAKSTNRANNFTEIQLNLIHNTDVNGRQAAVMMDTTGKLFVSYTYQTSPTDFDIFVRSSCDDGATFSDAVQFNTVDDDGFDVDPELGINPAGGIVLTWEENGYTALYGGGNDNEFGKIVARHIM